MYKYEALPPSNIILSSLLPLLKRSQTGNISEPKRFGHAIQIIYWHALCYLYPLFRAR